MLKELPETLDETYERILRDINKANWDHAHRLLQCLTVAVRPLRVAELAEVLAVDFEATSWGGTSILNTDWRWEDQQEAVLSTCSSLISVVDKKGSQIVQFSHFSVKEFLTSSRIASSSADVTRFRILPEPAHTILAKACLGVLLRLGELVDEDYVEDKFPLARYAAEHWVDHARFGDVSSHIREGMEHLFDPDKPYITAWLQVHDIDALPRNGSVLFYFTSLPRERSNATPLYYAALCGFHDLAEQLIIKHPQHVNAIRGYYVSPLGAALKGGHLKIAQLLYEHGADVDVRGRGHRTLLRGASSSGPLEIVQWLLSRNANLAVRDKDDRWWTSLHAAACYGNVEISRLLLQYKADVHAHDKLGRTPLHVVAEYEEFNITPNSRYLDIARLLVEHGANIDAIDHKGMTAFQIASKKGYKDIAQYLSDHGSK